MLHPHYKITISGYTARHSFDYWSSYNDYQNNKQTLNKIDLLDALSCFCADASLRDANMDFVDFAKQFGFVYIEDYEQAVDAYNGCYRQLKAYVKLFGKDWTIQEQIDEKISELS